MPPTTPRDFMRVSLQRLSAAEEIAAVLRRNLEAQYIGGYSVECSLKALLLEKTPEQDRLALLETITRGARHHRPDVLLGYLRERGVALTASLARRLRRFDWSTDLRYEIGRRDTGETNGLLTTARGILEWVEDQLP